MPSRTGPTSITAKKENLATKKLTNTLVLKALNHEHQQEVKLAE
jgi:hypothetical protein